LGADLLVGLRKRDLDMSRADPGAYRRIQSANQALLLVETQCLGDSADGVGRLSDPHCS